MLKERIWLHDEVTTIDSFCILEWLVADVDLNFLARQNERILHDLAGVRDELRVQGATIMRLEGAVSSCRSRFTWCTRRPVG